MKKYIGIIFILISLSGFSQTISVSSFKLLETDLDANTAGTSEKDQNGETAALIKVVTTQKGFIFDGGVLGIVKTVQKPGEIWIYVPRGMKKITISHPEFGLLRNYYLPTTIKAGCTYEILLDVKAEMKKDKINIGDIDINSDPIDADIYIDGKNIGQTPQIISNLSLGKHQIKIIKETYKDYTADVIIENNRITKLSAKLEYNNKIFHVGSVSFTMVLVDGGSFQMGATDEQGNDSGVDEKPIHQVVLQTYYIGQTEVTKELWENVMSKNYTPKLEDNNPVVDVSWEKCQEFIQKLNQLTGVKFRLPTEAEWEFAARGGNKSKGYMYSGSDTLDSVGWYVDNSNGHLHAVKMKKTNELGLYDMSGNVWEWCGDKYGQYTSDSQINPQGASIGGNRIYRGGSWDYNDYNCRNACRNWGPEIFNSNNLGFRLALGSPNITN